MKANYFNNIRKNSFLLQQLVIRDFKTKYKRSFLGIAWSLLNPLLMLLVQYAVFENLFKFQIENYIIYLLIGIVLFSFFQEAANQAMMSIVSNVSLINKAKLSKYVLPVSKVISTTINLLFSIIPLLILMIFTGISINVRTIIAIYGIVCLIIFCIGIGFILSSLQVFFRDVQFLWQIISLAWMYLTPIIYPENILSGSVLSIVKLNPMYHFLKFVRNVMIDNVNPDMYEYMICFGYAAGVFIIGAYIFKKVQNKFVIYL
jgi:ABC-2 type transport system permease protein